MDNIHHSDHEDSPGQLSSAVLLGLTIFLVLFGFSKIYQSRIEKHRKHQYLKEYSGPPGHWLTGHVRHMTLDETMITTVLGWMKKYGYFVRLNMFGEDVLMIGHPDGMAAVMKSQGPKDKTIYSLLSDWIGQGLITSEGPHWMRNRRLLTPAFHFEVLKSYTEVFQHSAADLIDKWRGMCSGKETTIEMFEHFSLMTLDSLLKTAFSTETNCQGIGHKHPYINAVYQITQATLDRQNSIILRSGFIFYNLTSQGRKTKKALQVAKEFTQDILRSRREERTHNTANTQSQRKYRDFVDMLLDAKDADGQGLTEEEILNEVDTFMFAGHDTTASGLSWLMYNLAKHPEYQQRCRDEINEILDDRDNINWSDLSKLEYLSMCVKESLRLYNPVPIVGRYLNEDVKFPDGRTAPKGTILWLSLSTVHRNEDMWENPGEFDPNRFTHENTQNRHSHAYVPFSAGPRNCIGQHFALNELKIVAALVLKNFHLDVDPNKVPKRVTHIALRSENGVWLKLTPL